ncbi:MAG: tetratricopeptide repeat protein [Oscillatoriales cyanobacterium C42_A2020_001]|nr:tetratricopeptide repeat protein [Leptolyngbyaceae cyanobacterium C42_A2020_001]
MRDRRAASFCSRSARLTGAIVFSALMTATIAQRSPAQDLNQQLTIQLNSGTRSPQRDRADRLIAEGKTHQANGDLAAAIAAWRKAQLLYQQIGDMDGQGLAYDYLMRAYAQTDQIAAREDAMRRQLAIARDQRNFTDQISANNNLGTALAPRASGSPAAGELFVEGMDVATSVRNQRGERLTADNLTWLANSLDQPDLKIRQYEFAFLPPSQWVANPTSLSARLNEQGDRRLNQQRYYMATRFNRVATTLADEANSAALRFQTLDDLVIAYRAMGRYDLATDSLEDRLVLARSLSDPREELATLAALGEINSDIGRVTLAQRYYEQAIVVAEGLNNPEQTSLLKERLASFEQPSIP